MNKTTFPIPIVLLGVALTSILSVMQVIKHETAKMHWTPPALEPNDWAAMQRQYPHGKINTDAFLSAARQAQALMTDASATAFPWEFTGPDNIGGRITDIESPAGNPSTLYVGAATGGIFKTTDMGATWTNLFKNVPVITVGDIALDPANPQVIYCGTGEANSSSFSFLGNGMYRSTDGGDSWTHIGLENSAYISRVIVDYSNPQRLFVAANGNLYSNGDQRGVYRTENGGATWEKVLFINDSTAAIDLVQHPQNPQIIFASMWERSRGLSYRRSFGDGSGIWKSTDGGSTWIELTNGLPTGSNVGRIGISMAKTNPDVIYAFYDLTDYEVGVYKTTNGGTSWTRTSDGALSGMNSNFGWYFGQIRVDPENENRVFVMGVSLFRTENGGNTWSDISNWDLHVDHHAMIFDETNNRVFNGNDGGLYYSNDYGNNWTKINNLPITQFYAIDIDYNNPQRIYGGTQDNNTIRTMTGGTSDWEAILGGDGMFTLVDYTDPNTIYCEYQWGNLYRSDDGGWNMTSIAGDMLYDRINWSAPLAMHPENPDILYFGTYRVWKTTNKGNSWTPVSPDLTAGIEQYFYTLTSIAVSKVDPAIVVAGSGDGKVHISLNNGQTWQNISAGLPQRWITRVATDPFDYKTIYVTVSGFRWDEPLPHVFKTNNLGQTWTDITGNLPEFPVNDIVVDPDFPGHLIVGTDAGVYATTSDGAYWYWVLGENPAVPIYMMKIHETTRKIVLGTYGLSTLSASLNDLYTGLPANEGKINGRLSIYPNPVSTVAKLNFHVPQKGKYTINLVDLQGHSTGKIFEANLEPGSHSVEWNPQVGQGAYMVSVEGKGYKAVSKALIVK